MSEASYSVVYKGQLLKGFDPETVMQNLMQAFGVNEQTADKIIRSSQMVLRKNLDEQAARKWAASFMKIGLKVVLRISKVQSLPMEKRVVAEAGVLHQTAIPQSKDVRDEPALQTGEIQEKEAVSSQRKDIPFEFHGSGSEYFRIWISNVLLTVLTLGIYSAWAKVRRKRYFYGNTRLGGAGFEYLAQPLKILKGRLLVAGFFLVSGILQNFMPFMNFITTLALIVILPWLVIRSRAFNARNSAFRNIRFGFKASYGEAAKVYILLPILAPLTLGLVVPYVYFRQRRFFVDNSRYGTMPFFFNAKAGDYYRILLIAGLIALGGIAVGSVVFLAFGTLVVLPLLAAYLYVFAFVSVKITNLLYNTSRISSHLFQSSMTVKGYFKLVLINTLATALTVGLFYPWAQVRYLKYKLEHLVFVQGGDMDSFIAEQQRDVSALGEEASDFMDFDFGL
ncbi:MAG: protein of unknown function transrane [Deltaproteobacteria bacterium]|nr:protein of unknown function transrane [Deltaproteobacteria bacterium]